MNPRRIHKLLCALLSTLVLSGLLVSTAWADGMVIPFTRDLGLLQVDYHRVMVSIEGQHASTRVEQRFSNPYRETIQGRYVFPLPPGAGILRFRVGLDGVWQAVRNLSRGESEAYLQRAITEWRDPSLLQYLGWETYVVDLTVPPLGTTTMVLEYEELLLPQGGLHRYFYTLGTERYSAGPLQEVSVEVDIQADEGVATVYSPGLPLALERVGDDQVRATYYAEGVLPTEHFELYYTLTDQPFGAGLLAHADPERPGQGHFLLILSPSSTVPAAAATPKDIVFVIDRSGSMAGEKIEQAQAALQFILGQLGERDRFAIVSFDDRIETQAGTLQPVSRQTIRRARSYVDALYDRGNTDIEGALQRGLALLAVGRPRHEATQMIVFLTDGLPTAGITDEVAIVDRVRWANANLGASLHVFGVGYDVNTRLLDRIAAQNHGTVTYVQPGESLESALTAFYGQIAHPLLTDVEVTFDGLNVTDVYPRELPDLFHGSSLALVGRYTDAGVGEVAVRLRGRMASESWEAEYRFDLSQATAQPFVARLWATRRIGELLDLVRVEGAVPELIEEVKSLGLRYGIVTPYTIGLVQGQATGAASLTNMRLYAQDLDGDGRLDINQVSGAATVGARAQNLAYQLADQANLAVGANVVNVGENSVAQLEHFAVDLQLIADLNLESATNVDDRWLAENVDRVVEFASAEYFALAQDATANQLMQAGPNVVFRYNGEVIAVQADPLAPQQGPTPADSPPAQPAPAPAGLAKLWSWLEGLIRR